MEVNTQDEPQDVRERVARALYEHRRAAEDKYREAADAVLAAVSAAAPDERARLVPTGFDDVGRPVVWEDPAWCKPVAGPPTRADRVVVPDHYGDGSLEVLYRAEVPDAPLTLSTTGHWSIDMTLDSLLGAIAEAGGPDLRAALAARPAPVVSGEAGGAALIAAERRRQVEAEGWTTKHDDAQTDGSLALAAAVYATPAERRTFTAYSSTVPARWPWHSVFWKPCPDDRVRELVKAGALIAAEIDRLRRAGLTVADEGRAEA